MKINMTNTSRTHNVRLLKLNIIHCVIIIIKNHNNMKILYLYLSYFIIYSRLLIKYSFSGSINVFGNMFFR